MADVAQLNVRVRTDGVTRASQEIDHLARTSTGAAGKIKGLVAGFAGFAAARSAVRVMADFEETFAQVRGIIGSTASESTDLTRVFGDLASQARDLGATTRFSATEAAQAQLFLARAGLTSNQILSELPATLNLASAGMLELGEAADIASNVLSTFGNQGLDLAKISDSLVATANRSNTDVRQLGEAFRYVGASASALNQDLDEVSSFLGILGNSGIQASLAGTTLNATINSLLKPTSAAKKVFAQLGEELNLTAEDFVPSANRSIVDILETIDKANLSVAQLAEVFGRTQATRGALIGIQNIDLIRQLTEAVREAKGEAEQLARIQEDTLAGSFRSLISAVQESVLQVGEAGLGGALRSVVETATDVIRVLTGFEDKVKGSSAVAENLASVVKALGGALGALALGKVVRLLLPLLGVIRSLTTATLTLNTAMAANPIGLLVAAVAGLVFAYDQLKDRTVTIGNETVQVGDIVGGVWDAVSDAVRDLIETVVSLGEIVVKGLPRAFEDARVFISETWQDLTEALGVDWKRVFGFIFDIVKTTVNKSIAVLVGLGKTVGTIAARLVDFFQAFSEFDFDAPVESAKRVGERMRRAINLSDIGSEIADDWEEAWNTDFVGRSIVLAEAGGKAIISALRTAVQSEDIRSLIPGANALLDIPGAIARRREQRLAAEKAEVAARREAEEAAKRAQAAEEKVKEVREALAIATKKVTDEQTSAIASINDMRAALLVEIATVGKSAEAAERYRLELEIQRLALEAVGEKGEEYNKLVGELTGLLDQLEGKRAFAKLSEDVREATSNLRDMVAAVEDEIALVGLDREERELAIAAREAEKLATVAMTEEARNLASAYVESVKALQQKEAAAERASRTVSAALERVFSDERLDRAGDALADSFASATRDILNDFDSIEDSLESLYRSAIGIFQDTFILNPLRDALGGALGGGGGLLGTLFGGGSAQGNAFRGGRIVPLAKGGILTEPTFAESNGTTFLAGEAGPEAVVPLARDSSGNLGIRNVGGAGAPQESRTYNVSVNINGVRDMDGFRRNRNQIATNIREIVRGI